MARKLSARQASREYRAWAGMIQRCCNPNHKMARRYHDRGIQVCAAWRASFESFLADMGECPPGLTLEREDNDGNYEPGNCRWATRADQSRNRSSNKMITFQGVTLCVTDWARRQGIPKQCLQDRLWRGWDIETALTLPADPKNSVKQREKGKHTTLTYDGVTLSVPDWADRQGLTRSALYYRLDQGWSVEDALTTPATPRHLRKSKEIASKRNIVRAP